ncbi:Fur-regulated basic protein FbpA [Neobacillus sp. PS3-12]|uniref:Fur-regulated basic protein FbpA n=1 Tax=Neobacillus sp. PS3-12 TaxID=3070677 RepID=UPI0027E088C9|nr:Fur-regulated basic protein FbpA [Neobacillus sp. PS3-12]WML51046.1 Fur-regulated basic protein FbpA [Neobacillus sp. PS3-12]
MSNYLRTAIEQVKQFYITKIIDANLQRETPQELTELTVSELAVIYKRAVKPQEIDQKMYLNRKEISQNIFKNMNYVRKCNISS